MRRTKQPSTDQREWAVIDTTNEEPPRMSWYRENARQIRDTLNTRDEGRYKVERRKVAP